MSWRTLSLRAFVAFDKDGTLLDFDRTWSVGLRKAAELAAANRPEVTSALVDAATSGSEPVFRHGSYEDLAELWLTREPALRSSWDLRGLAGACEAVACESALASAVALPHAERQLRWLSSLGISLAMVTNDSEASALAQIDKLGWSGLFGSVLGADSGFGAKPGSGGIVEAMRRAGVPPRHSIYVGDTAVDAQAAEASGCEFMHARDLHRDPWVL